MNRCIVIILLGMAFSMTNSHAQTHSDRRDQDPLASFRKSIREDFVAFRQKTIDEYIAFARDPWPSFNHIEPMKIPQERPIKPIVMPDEDYNRPIKDKPVIIKDVIEIPALPVTPRPMPLEPIEDTPQEDTKYVETSFWGTQLRVRFNKEDKVVLHECSENAIADALQSMRACSYDNLIIDCLALRDSFRLCDWAYLQMLKSFSDTINGANTNASTLMMSFLFAQSGYKMRLAYAEEKLYLLYACQYHIYDQIYYELDGERYYGVEQLPMRLNICGASFPKEQSLSLKIEAPLAFKVNATENRIISSSRHPDMKISVSVNKNLIDFYNTYPAAIIGNNFMTKWVMYAQTPLDEYTSKMINQQLGTHLKNCGEVSAVAKLLNLLQTGLVYEYDDKIWGRDRAFFSEETLFYPYCDCEDRAILMSRLVRDLLGLETLLVYYPGHLALAVCFSTDVAGDYIEYNKKKFVVCDPTYIGAPIGATMPGMDNEKATVILVQ